MEQAQSVQRRLRGLSYPSRRPDSEIIKADLKTLKNEAGPKPKLKGISSNFFIPSEVASDIKTKRLAHKIDAWWEQLTAFWYHMAFVKRFVSVTPQLAENVTPVC